MKILCVRPVHCNSSGKALDIKDRRKIFPDVFHQSAVIHEQRNVILPRLNFFLVSKRIQKPLTYHSVSHRRFGIIYAFKKRKLV